MKKLIMVQSVFALCVAIPAIPVSAESGATVSKDIAGLERFYSNLDQDNNGRLTEKEFLGFWTTQYYKGDRNKDGVLDQTEFLDGRVFEVLDTDKDGVIELDEDMTHRKRNWNNLMRSGAGWVSLDDFIRHSRGRSVRSDYAFATTFTKMDADRDGSLTEEEYLAFWNEYFENRDGNGDNALNRQEHGHADSFNSFDQNRNGKIELEEDVVIRKKDFKELDKDGGGSLSQSEFVR